MTCIFVKVYKFHLASVGAKLFCTKVGQFVSYYLQGETDSVSFMVLLYCSL